MKKAKKVVKFIVVIIILCSIVAPVMIYATEETEIIVDNDDIVEDIGEDSNFSEKVENDILVNKNTYDEAQEEFEKIDEESAYREIEKEVSGNDISYLAETRVSDTDSNYLAETRVSDTDSNYLAETWESYYTYDEKKISQFTYYGNASKSEEIINLCDKERQGAIVFIDEKITNMNCVMLEFDMFLGYGEGRGADGISVSFAPSINTDIPAGDKLGINNGAVGVCYTTYTNARSQSIRVVEDSAYTSKQGYTPTAYMDDGQWHTTKILYYHNTMSVIFDNKQVLYYTGIREIPEGYISIRGTTGASWNIQQIRNIKLYNVNEKNTDIDYTFHDIQVYSEFPNCIIGVNQTCAIMPVMAEGDDVIKGEEGWNYSIENTNIAEIQEYPKTDYGTAVSIVGKMTGSTKLHIIHIPTGKFVDVSICVVGNSIVYNLSDIIEFTNSTGIMNSGIFTNNYKSTRISGGYEVTFDAYNECASAGAVEVYNSEDQLIEAHEIKKFEAYQTGIKEVAMDGWNLVVSGFDGSINSITNGMYTKKTSIPIEKVPDGGYIVITNDIKTSLPAALYNLVDEISWVYKEVGILKNWREKEPFEDKAKINVTQELISAFLGAGYDKSAIDQFTDKLTKSVSKDLSINSKDMANMVVNLLKDADIVLQEKNIKLGEEIRDAAIDTGIDVAMDIFNKFSPTGDIIQGIFDVNETLNGFMQIVYVNKTMGGRSIRIDVNDGNDKLVSEGVIVEKSDGTVFTDAELIVVDITEEDASRYIIQNLTSASKIKIYNITLYRDDSEIQPDGKIRIKVPLPALYNKDKCTIYRVEADNSLTDMSATYLDGYMVFETEHLSNYVLYERFSYSITFDGNGASSGSMTALSDCLKDTEYNLPINTYARNNYSFSGWNTSQDGTGTSFSDGDAVVNLTTVNDETVTLYAQWKSIRTGDSGSGSGNNSGESNDNGSGSEESNNTSTGDGTGSNNDQGSSSGQNDGKNTGMNHSGTNNNAELNNELINHTDPDASITENNSGVDTANMDKGIANAVDMPKTGEESSNSKIFIILLLLISMLCFITFVPYNKQTKCNRLIKQRI